MHLVSSRSDILFHSRGHALYASVVLSVTIAARGSKTLSKSISRLILGKPPLLCRMGDSKLPISTSDSRSVVVGPREDSPHRRCVQRQFPQSMSRKRLRQTTYMMKFTDEFNTSRAFDAWIKKKRTSLQSLKR